MLRRIRCGRMREVSVAREGATVVETAFTLSLLLMILFTLLDLGLAVLQYNSLSAAARRTAREAIVHGENAAPERTEWGPTTSNGTAADATEHATVVRQGLNAVNPADVSVQLEWPDGDNRVGQRVRVSLSYQYEPILPVPFLGALCNLNAVSTMSITH